jgi:hypothetical protein
LRCGLCSNARRRPEPALDASPQLRHQEARGHGRSRAIHAHGKSTPGLALDHAANRFSLHDDDRPTVTDGGRALLLSHMRERGLFCPARGRTAVVADLLRTSCSRPLSRTARPETCSSACSRAVTSCAPTLTWQRKRGAICPRKSQTLWRRLKRCLGASKLRRFSPAIPFRTPPGCCQKRISRFSRRPFV